MPCDAPIPAEAPERVYDDARPPHAHPPAPALSQPPIVILNADDWALNAAETDCILSCARAGAISSVSAMVFMDDSERAAALAREHRIDAGLHLNLSCAFTSHALPSRLLEHQRRIIRFLRLKRYARIGFNPFLVHSFDYVTRAQIDEFERLYGAAPSRVDGHHHMQLCANVLAQKLLPNNAIIRRNQCFAPGEMSRLNRWYRRMQDRHVVRHYRTSDYFFDLSPIEPKRLRRILALARESNVEIATHPDKPEEYAFLMRGELARYAEDVVIAPRYILRSLPARAHGPIAESHA